MAEDPALWENPDNAQKVMRERTQLDAGLKAIDEMEHDLADNIELIELGEMENDIDVVADAEATIEVLHGKAQQAELQTLLSGEADSNDCYLEINAGAGGTEAQDWAEMLGRMYVRWCDSEGYKVELLAESVGEEAGIKSMTMKV